MTIHILTNAATREQLDEMLDALGTEIKVAVDVELGILAGGAELHADCEERLLDAGSRQEHVWGATWNAITGEVTYWSVINFRPRQGQRSPELVDDDLRARMEQVIRRVLEGA